MKTVSSGLQADLAANPTTLAWLFKVKRTDSTLLGFSSFDSDLIFDDGSGDGPITYLARSGFTQSAVEGNSDLAVDNSEAIGFLNSAAISENDLLEHKYDDAVVTLYVVNWANLSHGYMMQRQGTLGVIKDENGKFTAELRGKSYKLKTVLGGVYGPVCRSVFGSGLNGIDSGTQWPCSIDVTLYRQTGSVTAVPDEFTITPAGGLKMVGSATPTAAAGAGWFDDGIVTFTGGALDGLSLEIKTWDGTNLALYLPMLISLCAPGDTFTIEPGCNHTVYDCANKFDNVVNFHGEPSIPGMDSILDYPNAT